ncbi:protein downstream neighbor of son homolog [Strongylocentrotus purpuratus]|uniref:Protein downstream neighbor of Son n=1 Tax=Strongylocentrotus purpuratus TaxID=7668 RepID=A0A7M7PJ59_STRPU|nr:protein downstream neighbor of son homolog [Strongylocentrotus purpuratus]XP_030851125.1 protein downstream neighbor of son homolog [Strongylocentrotus purpuratus]
MLLITLIVSIFQQTEQVSSKPLARGKPDLTPDWCLRTRLRFTSHSSFSWCQPIRMKEEAKGLCSFVQGQHGPDTEEQETGEETSWRSDLQQATMCWMHPDIPWLNLFPRVVPEPKKFKQSIATKDTTIASALMTNWSESFRSVFHLLRSGHCPYFYLCTHHFTVLFRAAGIAATPTMHALMTPTTRGLREALKTEGISYTMPLHQEAPSPVETETTTATAGQQQKATEESCPEGEIEEQSEVNQEDDQIKKEIAEEEEEVEDILRSPTKASSWLQSMGLDKTNFPSLEPTRVKFQTDQLLKLDNRPQSLVLVEGLDTAALYNFLLNSRTVLTSVGPLADIPPTILSPIAFKGATLNSCKLKSGTLKQQSSKSSLVEVSSLEVTGPIMPHNVHSLCALLRRTQEGAFHMALSNHEATAPFTSCTYSTNEKSGVRDAGDEERLKAMRTNCGLSERQVEYLGSKCTVNLPTKEVTCTDRLFL